MKLAFVILASMLGATSASTTAITWQSEDLYETKKLHERKKADGTDNKKSMQFIVDKINQKGDEGIEESDFAYLYLFLGHQYGYECT